MTKTDYDPDRSLVLIEGLSHFLTHFLQNLASCQTSLRDGFRKISNYTIEIYFVLFYFGQRLYLKIKNENFVLHECHILK
jgi:hypothetical protein